MGKRGPQPTQTERMVFMISPELRTRLEIAAGANGMSKAIRSAIVAWLAIEERLDRGRELEQELR